jgi:hypothetical protein
MNGDDRDDVKTIIERIGGRISESGVSKRTTNTGVVDEEGTAHKITEVERGFNDCGHLEETGAVCHVCSRFTFCPACAEKFRCGLCQRIVCPGCSVESLLRPGTRFCRRCSWKGLLRRVFNKER